MIMPNTISEIIIAKLVNKERLYNCFHLRCQFSDSRNTGQLKVLS